ncbi:MAG: nucleotidyltransferase family protein [bacterium]|nr:nucleotidyltransferase family protein [bacterium]
MKAIILAGGLGTRLRPITYEIPKPLIPVKKKPIINHLIDLFHKHGMEKIGILASKMHKEDFEKWRGVWKEEMPDEKIELFYEETPRGTFGGMELLKDWIGKESFVLTNGDELKDFDLNRLREFHASHDGIASIWMVEVPNAHEYGVPILDGMKITEFLEKPEHPPSNFINSGLYVFDPEVFDYVDFSKEQVSTERDIFPRLAKEGKLFGHKIQGRWYDCGNLERWERAIKEW